MRSFILANETNRLIIDEVKNESIRSLVAMACLRRRFLARQRDGVRRASLDIRESGVLRSLCLLIATTHIYCIDASFPHGLPLNNDLGNLLPLPSPEDVTNPLQEVATRRHLHRERRSTDLEGRTENNTRRS